MEDTMVKMISRCGLLCTECPAFIATLENDDKKRAEVAELWSKQFKMEIKPEDVNCVGCLADGVHSSYCGMCEIRKCAVEKGIESCGLCDDYVCEKLEPVLSMEPSCRERLDNIRG
jgi:hypothetical protein